MVKYLIMDVDGSLTDGKIYMGPEGEAMKAFSVKDGMVFNYYLKPANIIPIVVTARNSLIVSNRCKELGIEKIYQGKTNKLNTLIEVIGEKNLKYCAYFGDDILDIYCMNPIRKAGGIIGCPSDAIRDVKSISDYVCINNAGNGALREFVEWLLLKKTNKMDIKERVQKAEEYLKQLHFSSNNVNKRIDVNDMFYYTIQQYSTKPSEKCILESHRKYVDIQIIISGRESMDIIDKSRLSLAEEYNEEKDIEIWNTPDRMSKVTLEKGDCIILYPEMAHRGAQILDKTEEVLKIVGKVRI